MSTEEPGTHDTVIFRLSEPGVSTFIEHFEQACGIATAIIVLFGLVSNIVNLVVFYKLELNTTTNICLFCLAVFDLTSLLFVAVVSLANISFIPQDGFLISFRTLCVVLAPVFNITYSLGAWTTTIITLERSCAVVFPLKVRQVFTKRTVKVMLIMMLIYLVAADIPYFFSFGLKRVTSVDNRTQYVLDRARQNPKLAALIATLSLTVPTYICAVVIIIGTVFLIISLKRSKELRNKMTAGDKSEKTSSKEAKVIKLVILICVIFIVGFVIGNVKPIASLAIPRLNRLDPLFAPIANLLTLLRYVALATCCAINIFVYLTLNPYYKMMFAKIFLGKVQD